MPVVPQDFTRLRSLLNNDFVTQQCLINFGNEGLSSIKVSFAVACALISLLFLLLPLCLTDEILGGSVFALLSLKSNESSNRSNQFGPFLLNQFVNLLIYCGNLFQLT